MTIQGITKLEFIYSSIYILIEVQLIYNAVLISAVQQSDSVIYIYIYINNLFNVLFHCGLSQDIKYSSLWYIVSSTLLFIRSIFYIYNSLHLLIPNSQSIPSPQPPPDFNSNDPTNSGKGLPAICPKQISYFFINYF